MTIKFNQIDPWMINPYDLYILKKVSEDITDDLEILYGTSIINRTFATINKESGQVVGISIRNVLNSQNTLHVLQNISFMKKLEHIDLSNNKLDFLPQEFQNLSYLKSISLDENDFTRYPQILLSCPKLESFHLNSNPLDTIPWMFVTTSQILSRFMGLEDPPKKSTFMGESLIIFVTLLKEYKKLPKKNHQNMLFQEFFYFELKKMYPLRKEILFDKIKNNIQLDPLDWTHPEFGNWQNELQFLCQKHVNDTSQQLLQIIDEKMNTKKCITENEIFLDFKPQVCPICLINLNENNTQCPFCKFDTNNMTIPNYEDYMKIPANLIEIVRFDDFSNVEDILTNNVLNGSSFVTLKVKIKGLQEKYKETIEKEKNLRNQKIDIRNQITSYLRPSLILDLIKRFNSGGLPPFLIEREVAKSIIFLNPWNSNSWVNLAISYKLLFDYNNSEKCLNYALNLEKNNLYALQVLLDLKHRQNQIENITEIFNLICKIDPIGEILSKPISLYDSNHGKSNALRFFERAMIENSNGNFISSEILLFEALDQSATHLQSLWLLGLVYMKQGYVDLALHYFSRAKYVPIGNNKDILADVYGQSGVIYLALGDPTHAIENFSKSNELMEPNNATMLLNWAIAEYQIGQNSEAKRLLTNTEKLAYSTKETDVLEMVKSIRNIITKNQRIDNIEFPVPIKHSEKNIPSNNDPNVIWELINVQGWQYYYQNNLVEARKNAEFLINDGHKGKLIEEECFGKDLLAAILSNSNDINDWKQAQKFIEANKAISPDYYTPYILFKIHNKIKNFEE